ncbi:MAG: major facilitator superfamily domain-containing protein [Monoraphidium minutum]|nr:MAG: major facilitator superfamily domain-containing protein [Monoraphidium minutum]
MRSRAAPEILIAFRALQGAAISAFGVSAVAIVADVFPPESRGRAMGLATIPVLVGPVIGPMLGGVLSQAFGWRSTFSAMAILGVVILLAVFLFLEETHHYHVLSRVKTVQGAAAWAAIKESQTTPVPTLAPPYRPLLHLIDPVLLPHVLGVLCMQGTLYACMIVIPYKLAAPPYNLGQSLIGVCAMATGLGLLCAAPLGGALADRASRRWPASPSGRMLIGAPAALATFPAAALAFGWALQRELPLGVPLAACVVMGLGIGMFTPAVWALVSIRKQSAAAAAGGAQSAATFVCGGLFVVVTPVGMDSIGIGRFATLLAALCALALSFALASSVRRCKGDCQGGGGGAVEGPAGAVQVVVVDGKDPGSPMPPPPPAAAKGRAAAPGAGGGAPAAGGAAAAGGDAAGGGRDQAGALSGPATPAPEAANGAAAPTAAAPTAAPEAPLAVSAL